VEAIRKRILSGEYQSSRRIPSQAELATEFAVPGRTIAVAIAELRGRGYLWTLPHKAATPAHPNTGPKAAEAPQRSGNVGCGSVGTMSSMALVIAHRS
jgi:DNA-binding transcriptional MocR family regulator